MPKGHLPFIIQAFTRDSGETIVAKPKVFITRPIPEAVVEQIREMCEVEMWPTSETRPPIAAKISALDGLVTYGHEPVTAEMMETAPNLKAIAVVGVGFDHIDTRAARERGIAVGNTPGCLEETTADMTFALMLAVARNLRAADRHIQSGKWTYYDPNIFWGTDMHHATLGIVGMGGIGREVAKRAKGFDMRVLYNKRQRRPDWEGELGVIYASLDELLAESDFVTLHVPLGPQTRHLIGEHELKRMKPTAILVNIARGPVVDSRALYRALRDGEIAGAALDVTDPEPPPVDDPLLGLDNLLITPHLGSASVQTRTRMAEMAAQNLRAALRGEVMPFSIFSSPSH